MARFCFVSNALVTHCDMGGMSFLRTAEELKNRGHEVQWVFSPLDNEDMEARAFDTVRKKNIDTSKHVNLVMTNKESEVFSRTFQFQAFLEYNSFDCVVIDRLCTIATFSAHRARIPWAAVGTDGQDWCYTAPVMMPKTYLPDAPQMSGVSRLVSAESFPTPSIESHWATSPFLNICYFPKAYYEGGGGAKSPPQSHFLGSGPVARPTGSRSGLLMTFGNTFPQALRLQVLKALRPFVRAYAMPLLILTGKEAQAKMLKAWSWGLPQVTVKTWAPYDEAYGDASVVIGHGGYSQMWYSLWAGTPMLAIPSIGDQWHGGCRLERLGIGRAVPPEAGSTPSSLKFRSRVGVNAEEFVDRLAEIVSDPGCVDRISDLSTTMRQGGGVMAGAALLERLATDKEPVEACIEPHCCC